MEAVEIEVSSKLDELFKSILLEEVYAGIGISNDKRLELSEETIRIAKKTIQRMFKSDVYTSTYKDYLSDVNKAIEEREKFFKKQKFTLPNISDKYKLAIDFYLEDLNEMGLNNRYNQKIRRAIFFAIQTGASIRDLTTSLDKLIKADSLGKYVKNTIQNIADAQSSVLNKSIVDKNKSKIKGFTMVGSLIDTSSEQCQLAVDKGRKLSLEEWEKVIKFAQNRKQLDADYDVYDLPTKKLHYGCRHEFIPYK
jgi:hypothetical protein